VLLVVDDPPAVADAHELGDELLAIGDVRSV